MSLSPPAGTHHLQVIAEKTTVVVDDRPTEFSDDALAQRFEEEYGDHMRYVAAWSRWFSFDGQRWKPDDTRLAFDRSRAVCRKAAKECEDKKARAIVSSARSVNAVLTLASSSRQIAATVDQWDADPWLLNTPNGVVDLRTGQMRPHRPEDYMTKMTGVAPDPNCDIQTWLDFLDRITEANDELVGFLQRLSGYSLTGVTYEHSLSFLYGRGSNGKTTFLNAITQCAGDYHKTSPIETFTETKNERHPTELASLHGARLVTAVETEEGRRWAESKIKALTGGDRISARFMRQDFFEFTPQFKLMVTGNHKPGLRSVDEAIKRRLNLIPFNVTIPKEEQDVELPNKLKAELPGILYWMIQGCLEWQQNGLNPPECVKAATEAYRDAEDPTSAWIEERCIREPNAKTNRTHLHADWVEWAAKSGETAGSARAFYDRLEGKGFDQVKISGVRHFKGLRLKEFSYG
jgi:putative DNA primase/helicase